jgi:hypothetical protein
MHGARIQGDSKVSDSPQNFPTFNYPNTMNRMFMSNKAHFHPSGFVKNKSGGNE